MREAKSREYLKQLEDYEKEEEYLSNLQLYQGVLTNKFFSSYC